MKTLVVLVVLLLVSTTACISPTPAPTEYLAVRATSFRGSGQTYEPVDLATAITELLNKHAAEGWACVAMSIYSTEQQPTAYLVLARPRRAGGGQ